MSPDNKRAAAGGAFRPMQHGAAGKMAAAADQGRAIGQRQRIAVPEFYRRIRPHDPLAVAGVQIDRDVEGMRPFDHRSVIMRMRDRDADQPAQCLDDGDSGVVEERNAVPQHVALVGRKQQRPLPDGEHRHGADADEILFVLPEAVEMAAFERVVRRPGLTGRRHILAIFVADRAALRRLHRWRELCAAGDADKGGHAVIDMKSAAPQSAARPSAAAAVQLRTLYFLNQPIICAQASSAASLR